MLHSDGFEKEQEILASSAIAEIVTLAVREISDTYNLRMTEQQVSWIIVRLTEEKFTEDDVRLAFRHLIEEAPFNSRFRPVLTAKDFMDALGAAAPQRRERW